MRATLGPDPTSYRMVWTEVAWLAALLVGLSLLLTRLRLNHRRQAAVAMRAAGPRRYDTAPRGRQGAEKATP